MKTKIPFVSLLLAGVVWFVPASPARESKAAGKSKNDTAPQLLSTGEKATWASAAELKKAAESGDPEAALELGLQYENGGELGQDYIEARRWYTHASRAGLVEADFRLGRLTSEGLGGSEDQTAAYAYYRKAAEGGIALAQYNVGAMLSSGRGVTRNYVEGLAWLIVASRDPEVDPEGEKRLRAHLSRRPADVQAAEARAAEIAKQLDEKVKK